MVAEYKADELADDSDDEKRLYRAQKKCESKRHKTTAALKKKPRQEGAAKQYNNSVGVRPPGKRSRLGLVTTVEVGVI